MLPPRWYLLLCQGHNTLETGLLLLHPETVLWSKGRGAQCSSGILKKAWSQAKQAAGRLPLGQDIPSALCLSHYCTSLSGVTTETKPVSHTIPIPDFLPLHASSISGGHTTLQLLSHLTTARVHGCENSILQITHIPL